MDELLGCMMEFIMALFEPSVLSMYVECIPKRYRTGKKNKKIRKALRIAAVCMLIVMMIGVGLLTFDGSYSAAGGILIGISGVYFAVGTVIKLLACVRRRR